MSSKQLQKLLKQKFGSSLVALDQRAQRHRKLQN